MSVMLHMKGAGTLAGLDPECTSYFFSANSQQDVSGYLLSWPVKVPLPVNLFIVQFHALFKHTPASERAAHCSINSIFPLLPCNYIGPVQMGSLIIPLPMPVQGMQEHEECQYVKYISVGLLHPESLHLIYNEGIEQFIVLCDASFC